MGCSTLVVPSFPWHVRPIRNLHGKYRHDAGDGDTALPPRADQTGPYRDDQVRYLGTCDRDSLQTRLRVGRLVGMVEGDHFTALSLLTELLPDLRRVLGFKHPESLYCQVQIAHWTGEVGNVDKALRLYKRALPVRQDVLGTADINVLSMRREIGWLTARAGRTGEALEILQGVLVDQRLALGTDHPQCTQTVIMIAQLRGESEDL